MFDVVVSICISAFIVLTVAFLVWFWMPTLKEANKQQKQNIKTNRSAEYEKLINRAKAVGVDLKNPKPYETLAFFTVYGFISLPKSHLHRNDLSTYDSVIFSAFFVRALCFPQISKRENAENFSRDYMDKVLEYFPEHKQISEKYDKEMFENRVRHYDSIMTDKTLQYEERINKIVAAFEKIMAYDYNCQYVHIDENTPFMVNDIFIQFELTCHINTYIDYLLTGIKPALPQLLSFYNK